MNIEIIKAKQTDIDFLTEIEKHCFSDPWNRDTLIYSIDNDIVFILKADEKPLGYIICQSVLDEMTVLRIGVLPEFRRSGYAEKLLRFITEKSDIAVCFLEVRKKNTAARKLYEKVGFKSIGERKNYYKEPADDAVIMIKSSNRDLS
ncbi:MAG: ribosomal protein S18-alanine N-acetyltransferase [Ruminococcus sp.]|jgi:ribosomal-protein-alanine N-acetyltransferase|nr:ribosomal protein S18-alanine N-acetyltransferase [Ruminococcus sp.]